MKTPLELIEKLQESKIVTPQVLKDLKKIRRENGDNDFYNQLEKLRKDNKPLDELLDKEEKDDQYVKTEIRDEIESAQTELREAVEEDQTEYEEEDDQPPKLYDEDEDPANNRPLVFVPGIMGSALEISKPNGVTKVIWPPFNVANTELTFNSPTELANDIINGVPSKTFKTFDAYSGLLATLNKWGYSETKKKPNLLVFNYNWTKSNRDSGAKLAQAIKVFLDRFNADHHTNFKEVDVICHSMGGFVTRAAIAFNKAPVRRTVYIATPHYGSPKAYFILRDFAFYTKFNLVGSGFWGSDFLISTALKDIKLFTDKMEKIEQALNILFSNAASAYELMPDANYFKKAVLLNVKWEQAVTKGVDYTRNTDETYLSAMSFISRNNLGLSVNHDWPFPAWQQKMVKDAMRFKNELGDIPGKYYLIYSAHLDTCANITYNCSDAEFEDLRNTKGDQTVPALSARAIGSKNPPIESYCVNGIHAKLPNEEKVLKVVKMYLKL